MLASGTFILHSYQPESACHIAQFQQKVVERREREKEFYVHANNTRFYI